MSETELDFHGIGEGVLRELNRRLGTPELAADLPGTLLMKIASDYTKYLEKQQEIEQQKLDQEKTDPLTIIDQEGLPIEMRVVILSEYLDECEQHWVEASARMEELLKEVIPDDPEVVPEVPEVVPEV